MVWPSLSGCPLSHIYQPVMIKELLARGGKAGIRDIAAAFLARDANQHR